MTSTRAAATLVIGIVIFRVNLVVLDPLLLTAIFLVTLVALYGLGMLFASVYLLYGREAWNAAALMQEPVFLASGLFFPIRIFVQALGPGGFWVAAAGASIIPMTLGLDAIRQLLFPDLLEFALLPAGVEFLILLILTPIFLLLARASLAYLERLGKEQGRLTLRHQ